MSLIARASRMLRPLGLPALLLLLPAALIAIHATARAEPVVGTPFSIASGWAGVGAAFDGTNFLVALESDTTAAKAAVQLMSPTGTQIGSPVALGVDGQSCCTVGIAFDGTNYLVTWEDDQGIKNSPEPFRVFGQFINTSGATVGAAFAMTTAGIWFDGSKMLAYGGGNYLLTYTRLIVPANGDNSDNRYVAGRIVAPDGTLGSEFRISAGLGNGSSVEFDGTNFFVIWKEDSQDFEVRGRFVSPAGVPGAEISINASTAFSDNPVLATFDGTNYMVVWTDMNALGTEADVLGQRVSPAGALVGGAITISSEPGFQMASGVAFNGTDHMVVWIDMSSDANGNRLCDTGEGTCWDIYGQIVGQDGTLFGARFAINTDTGNQIGGIGCAGGMCLALVSSDIVFGQGGPSQVGAVYGAFLTPSETDLIAPGIPSGLSATAVSQSQINLSWTASTDNVAVTAYRLVRDGVFRATVTAPAVSFNDTGLAPTLLYSYTVAACDAAGNCSTPSALASATTLVAGFVAGPSARAQFEGFRDGPTADTFIDFNSFAAGTALTTQVSGVTFSSNINTAGNPFGPIEVYVSSAPQCAIRCIVGTPFAGGSDDGRVGYQIVFATPQRRAGLQRIWTPQTVTRFYNQSDQLLGEYLGSGFVGFIAPGTDPATQWVKRIQIDGLVDPGDMITRQVGYSDDLFFGTAQAGFTFTPNLVSGFNLIGNSLDITIDVAATFGNLDAPVAGVTGNLVSLWKWNAALDRWAFYTPQLSANDNAALAESRNYDLLAAINPGEGYWVNAIAPMSLPAQSGTPYNWDGASFSTLPQGFNLIAHADSVTPSEFNINVSVPPPGAGVIPTNNFVTLWAWDAVAKKWYFYSPLTESTDGLAGVKAYCDSRFYLHFQDFEKTLGLGVGFWVSRP